MKTWLPPLAVLVALLPAAGCTLYTGGDDTGDDQCNDLIAEGVQLRNPDTGQCEYVGGGGGCGFVGDRPLPAEVEFPNWALCSSSCDSLDEQSCTATAGCQAAYRDYNGGAGGGSSGFLGCWATLPPYETLVASDTACSDLVAGDCSHRDDCSPHYNDGVAYPTPQADGASDGSALYFQYCAPEQPQLGCYADSECPGGTRCTADTECLPPPGCTGDVACPTVCYGRCVPAESCDDLRCKPGSHCEIVYGGGPGSAESGTPSCVPDSGCENIDCGPNYACEVQCDGGGPTDPTGGPPSSCYPTCVPLAPPTCDGVECFTGHCELQCGDRSCWPVCVDDQPPGCDLVDCMGGFHCEQQCYPVDAAGPFGPIGGTAGGAIDPTVPYCNAACVPDFDPSDPGECFGVVPGERPTPACPDGTTPGSRDGRYTGYCIPLSACGPQDPGHCDGPVACDAAPPECPVGSVPGITGACWSGYCIPASACGAGQACGTITTEDACLARPDCSTIYTGEDCTCSAFGCSCATQTFARCDIGVGPR